VLPGIIGCLQATEALKLLLGQGRPLLGRLVLVDALELTFKELRLRRDPGCPVCGDHPSITHLTDLEPVCDRPASEDHQPVGLDPAEVSVEAMRQALEQPGLGITVIDVREPDERSLAAVPGTRHIPLSALADRLDELDPERPYYLHCQAGVRSLRAVALLRTRGFRAVHSVQGGLMAWATAGGRVAPP
jgi:adenylyltransferase/sulfurtransferase